MVAICSAGEAERGETLQVRAPSDILKIIAAVSLVLLGACRTTEPTAGPGSSTRQATATVEAPVVNGDAAGEPGPAPRPAPGLAARPYELVVPDATDGGPLPLVVLLHGYGSSGRGHEGYFGLSRVTRARGVLLAVVDGTRDPTGKQFWNATDACCNFYGSAVDDVAYLGAVLDDIERENRVDPTRIYLLGHSNGAFMAHRFACDEGARVAAIVALAGVPPIDAAACASKGVSVLQVHGDADGVIAYRGGKSFGNGKPYPSADDAVREWARRDGCGATRAAAGPALDLDRAVAGAETTRERFEGCPAGVDVELWTMHGSGHVPSFGPRWADAAVDFLLRHHR